MTLFTDPRPGRALLRFARANAGLFLLLLLLLPAKIWRASNEDTLWCDEIYSLFLSFQPVREVVTLAASDRHPPAYYLVLKGWIAAPCLFGVEAGLLWARSLNLCTWVLLAACAWILGRAMLGPTAGVVLAWAVLGNALLGDATRNLRGYGFAYPTLFLCFLLLLRLNQLDGGDAEKRNRASRYWIFYGLAASAALWTHLLSAVVLFEIGLLWVSLAVRKPRWRGSFLVGGFLAQGVLALLFLAWLPLVPGQMTHLKSADISWWMTPPTVGNLLRVFTFWYPFGDALFVGKSRGVWMQILGGLAALIPFGAFLAAAVFFRKRKTSDLRRKASLEMGIWGIVLALLYVLVLWSLARFGVAKVFHGPRYTVLAAAFWAAGLAGLSCWSASRFRWRPGWSWLLVSPYLLCSAIGQIWAVKAEARLRPMEWTRQAAAYLPAPGEPLFVIPGEFAAYFRRSLREYALYPVEDLRALSKSAGETSILQVTAPFSQDIESPYVKYLRQRIEAGRLAEETAEFPFRAKYPAFRLYRLKGVHEDRVREVFAEASNSSTTLAVIPPEAVSKALAINQSLMDGWYGIEGNLWEGAFRWGKDTSARIRFDRPVRPGTYTLHYCGYGVELPVKPADIQFQFLGESDQRTFAEPKGPYLLRMPCVITRKHRKLVLRVQRPRWFVPGSKTDKRPRSQLFIYAFLTPGIDPAVQITPEERYEILPDSIRLTLPLALETGEEAAAPYLDGAWSYPETWGTSKVRWLEGLEGRLVFVYDRVQPTTLTLSLFPLSAEGFPNVCVSVRWDETPLVEAHPLPRGGFSTLTLAIPPEAHIAGDWHALRVRSNHSVKESRYDLGADPRDLSVAVHTISLE